MSSVALHSMRALKTPVELFPQQPPLAEWDCMTAEAQLQQIIAYKGSDNGLDSCSSDLG